MTFDEKYPVTALYDEPQPGLIRYKERGDEDFCTQCSAPTRWFYIETQEYVCSDLCLKAIETRDQLAAVEEDEGEFIPKLTAGRIEENWMDRQAKVELRELLREHPEFTEEVKSLSPGDALVHIYQKLGGSLRGNDPTKEN